MGVASSRRGRASHTHRWLLLARQGLCGAGTVALLGLVACGGSNNSYTGDAGREAVPDAAVATDADEENEPVDGGDIPDAGGELEEDGGVPVEEEPLFPAHIDCEDAADATTRWCEATCEPYDVDLGFAERVRWYGRAVASPRMSQCVVGGDGLKVGALWRAPWTGRWVVDNFGSEGDVFLRGVVDAACDSENSTCNPPKWRSSVALDLEEGAPLVVESEESFGERGGARVHRVNISQWVAYESGPDCLDGVDNDADGAVDCYDPDCAGSPECTTPLCADEILPSSVPLRVEGELSIEDHPDRHGGCAGMARERVFAWLAPRTGRFVVDMNESKFMGRLSVRRGSCTGPEVGACPIYDPMGSGEDSISTSVEATAGEWIYILVSASSDNHAFGASGELTHYVLEVRDWAPENCDDTIDNDGDGLWVDPECYEE